MKLSNEIELSNTRQRLDEIEAEYQHTLEDQQEDPRVRELTLWSLRKLMNQLKEEILRYEAQHSVRA